MVLSRWAAAAQSWRSGQATRPSRTASRREGRGLAGVERQDAQRVTGAEGQAEHVPDLQFLSPAASSGRPGIAAAGSSTTTALVGPRRRRADPRSGRPRKAVAGRRPRTRDLRVGAGARYSDARGGPRPPAGRPPRRRPGRRRAAAAQTDSRLSCRSPVALHAAAARTVRSTAFSATATSRRYGADGATSPRHVGARHQREGTTTQTRWSAGRSGDGFGANRRRATPGGPRRLRPRSAGAARSGGSRPSGGVLPRAGAPSAAPGAARAVRRR